MNALPDPAEASAEQAQAAIAEEFAFFGDWTERYQYLIDLGRKLPPFPEALQREEFKVSGGVGLLKCPVENQNVIGIILHAED